LSNQPACWKLLDQLLLKNLNLTFVFLTNFLIIFSIKFQTTLEPDFESDRVVCFGIVEQSNTSDVVEVLYVTADKPNQHRLPKVVN
jgi:hypothetical protein